MVVMPASATDSYEINRTAGLGLTGTIVLSSSRQLLFIDRKALDLLGLFDQDSPARAGTEGLPACLMTVAEEILAVHATCGAAGSAPSTYGSRLLGPSSQPIRVQGCTAPSRGEQDIRIVLVLSQCD